MPNLLKMSGDEDGESQVVIHTIEGRFPASVSAGYALMWCQRALGPGDFGEQSPGPHGDWDELCPLFKEYGANGKCWQKTGIKGFLDSDLAVAAFAAVAKHSRRSEIVDRWRLVTLSVVVRQVTAMEAPASN